jgi:N-methylhydantoinase B/oxoprolinase/acetone carboxylase alpha subunit
VADRIPAYSSCSSTPLASFNYTDAKRTVDPIGEEFFNSLLERDPALVIEDLADGYVSVERVKKDYGVMILVVDDDLGEYEVDVRYRERTGLHPCKPKTMAAGRP